MCIDQPKKVQHSFYHLTVVHVVSLKFLILWVRDRLVGQRQTPHIVDQRQTPDIVGQRQTPDIVGQIQTPDIVGQRQTR